MTEEIQPKKSLLKSIFTGLTFGRAREVKGAASLEKVVKRLIYLMVIIIPLWFLPITVNAVEFNKQVLMVLLVVITLILWLIKILSQGEIRWKSNILNVFIGVFLVVCILATVFSLRPYSSLVGWVTHLSGSLINVLAFL